MLLDEVHLLNEAGRGSSLEAGCVCRIKAIAAFPQLASAAIASVRFVAVSATIPNIGDVSSVCTDGALAADRSSVLLRSHMHASM